MSAQVFRDSIFEDSGFSCLARILGPDGNPIMQSDITSIERNVFDLNDGTTVSQTNPTVSAVLFDTLQTDDIWKKDSTGYNFKDAVADTIVATGEHRYRVEYVFNPVASSKFVVVFELLAEKLFS